MVCCICFQSPVTRRFIPCNHSCFCLACATSVMERAQASASSDRMTDDNPQARCPICRASVVGIELIPPTVCQLQYDEKGSVIDWGPPNATILIDACLSAFRAGSRVLAVPCWTVLWVEAEIRDFPPSRHSIYHGDRGWERYHDYFVAGWEDVRPIFDKYFSTCGCYHRVSWRVEQMHWTEQDGWEEDDCL